MSGGATPRAGGARGSVLRVEDAGAVPFAEVSLGRLTVLSSREDATEVLCVGLHDDPVWEGDAWRLLRISAESGTVIAEAPLPGVGRGIFEGCRVGDEIALADADGVDLGDPGDSIQMVDAATLSRRRAIEIEGMPAALAAWGERLLVCDGIDARLMLFEPGTTTPAKTLELGGPAGGTADLVVFD